MKTMIINGKTVEFDQEKNVLDIIRKQGISIPTLCYDPELTLSGSCRLCIVENGRGKMVASCCEQPREGMEIKTHSEKVLRHRKTILELILASHEGKCQLCHKNLHCKLQSLAMELGVADVRFEHLIKRKDAIDLGVSLVRDSNKCVMCTRCVRACDEIQGLGVLSAVNRGFESTITPAFNRPMDQMDCVKCGQCAQVCPTGALSIHDEISKAWKAIHDEKKLVAVSIAPSVRVALGEEFNMPVGSIVTGKIVAALRRLGFDEVYDTDMGADLTVVEETAEFVDRLTKGENLPLFTSCCPAWIQLVKRKYPELAKKNVSSCRSPQGMQGAALRAYHKENPVEGKELFAVSIMPCTAKKYEITIEDSYTDGVKDTDVVLTTHELANMIKQAGLNFTELPEEEFDKPLGSSSGAAVLFGVTGGVTEAVLRRAYAIKTNKSLRAIAYSGVRGFEGVKEAEVDIGGGIKLSIAIVNGLKNAQELIDSILRDEKQYDIIEVMACPGGCVGGGGQPYQNINTERKHKRGEAIYAADAQSEFQFTDENDDMNLLYETLLKGKEAHLFHNPSRHAQE